METYILLGFVLILSIYLGLELIAKVPSTLHTPLMSGANAISGIALVGALILSRDSDLQNTIAFFRCYICIYKCIWWAI
jgi:NAD(P) transhydrogenase subunit alpha